MTEELTQLTRIAEQAVGIGYDIIMNTAPANVQHKGDRDIVTDVDLTIEYKVREFLNKMTPNTDFLGEEEASSTRLDSDRDVWTLDPVDGTSNFAHGIPLYAISLALVRQGEPIVASIVAPVLGLHYVAAKGRGAFGNGVQLQVSNADSLSESVVSIGDYAVGDHSASKNERRLRLTALLAERVERVRMFGSAALDLAWVAEGRTDATIILANKPWDTAAGVLLAREAGALVIDATGKTHNFTSTATIAVSPGIGTPLTALTGDAS